jgi:hypothetical protein
MIIMGVVGIILAIVVIGKENLSIVFLFIVLFNIRQSACLSFAFVL